MIVNGGVRNGGGPGRFYGGVTAASVERAKWAQAGNLRNIHAGEATVIGGASISDRNGYPVGYLHPRTWCMPIKPGGMSMRALANLDTTIDGEAGWDTALALAASGAISASAVGAFLASLSASASASIGAGATALAYMTVSIDGAMAESFVIVGAYPGSAAMSGVLGTGYSMSGAASVECDIAAVSSVTIVMGGGAAMTVSLAGVGALSPSMVGAFIAAATIPATGTLGAGVTAPASAASAMAGAGSLVPTLRAQANMSLTIAQSAEEISPDAIASAVWAHGSALSLIDAVALIRKISDNRLEVDIAGQRLVLYDDDGATELREWALTTDGGEDVATATGVQTKRGAPA